MVVVVVVVLPLVVVVRLQSIRDAAEASRSFSSGSTREWCMLMNIDLRKNNDDDSPSPSSSDVGCTSRVCARVISLMDT